MIPVDPSVASAFGSAELKLPHASRSRALRRGMIFIGLVVALAIAAPATAIQMRKDALLVDLERRLEILARGRTEVIETWLDGLARPVSRLAESDLFRLFATEVDLSGGDISELAAATVPADSSLPDGLGVPLTAQLPFMEQVLTDFTQESGFLSGYLVGRNGVAYVTSAGADTILPEQQARAARLFEDGAFAFGPLRTAPAGLLMDIYAPLSAAQAEPGAGRPVGVLLLTTQVNATLAEILDLPPLARPGERLALVQAQDGALVRVAPGAATPLQRISAPELASGPEGLPFAERPALGGEGSAFSVAMSVDGPPWWIVQEIDTVAAKARLSRFKAGLIALAVLVVAGVVGAFGAFWWRLANEHSFALATQFRGLAARIEAQKTLLDGINDTIAEYIGLKGPDGTYRYVNAAFARAIGREAATMVGLDDAAIFGQGTAERLALADQRALASGTPVTLDEEIHLGKRLRYLQISKVPYRDASSGAMGIVSVARDVSELVEEQRKRERAVRQMIAALVRGIELRDPYLAGHSRRVAGFAVAVAQRLGCNAEEVATLDIAANLSQIGKLAVSRDVLTKAGRLSEAELLQMRRHVDHAGVILRDIDFELPVLETVTQMHERLDGSGYPSGLSGMAIARTARILGACDVFCARVEPRAHRAGIAPAQALAILEENGGHYDAEVVAALRQVVDSVAGEKLIAGLPVKGVS